MSQGELTISLPLLPAAPAWQGWTASGPLPVPATDAPEPDRERQ